MELPFEEEESCPDTQTSITCRLDGNLPTVELARSLGFEVNYVLPLKNELMKRPSRVPTPEFSTKYLDTDDLLFLLMTTLKGGTEPHARDYCIRWHCSKRWDDKELMQRFMWSHAKAVTDEHIRLSFLKCLYNSLDDEEFVFTAKGFFGKDDVQESIEKLERSIRIVSISQLRSCSRYEEVIAIITRDVDFNSMDGDDLFIMVEYLLDAYSRVKKHNCAMDFASRVFHLLFSYKQLPLAQVSSLLNFIYNTEWNKVTEENSAKIGDVSVEYIQSLDPVKHDDSLPSLALDVLVKAHEKLGERKTCGRDKGAFLLFFMEQLYTCILNEKVMAVLQREEYYWVWSNVSEEISQCLYCLFGRYSKRRRALEDHDCIVTSPELEKHSTMILELAMPHPLPQYDDKERLGHDVVDLLLNKFPSVLKYSVERGNVLDKFNVWMRDAARENATNRLQWPTTTGESYVQACIWYLMALHHYRQGNHDEIEKYSKLFLTSGYATLESRITAGVWAVLAYTSVYRIFQMDDDLLFLEWPWHVLPFRVSVLVDNKIGVVFFQLASTLYQIATRLSRYFLTLPSDDWRLRRAETLLKDLRSESLRLFEEALSKAHGEAGGICEYQWLGYFFVAKLQAKLNESDVVKVVDGLYEAACSCELSEFFYPIKINVKKQQNIEPVELHYQVHSTVWKYLCRTPNPSLKTLVSLLAYLRAMQSHKVNDIVTRVDLMDEIWNLCHRGFELVTDRFPHMKSYYRLAEMELSRGNVEVAYNHLTKHVFRRKKRDDSLFDSVVEITSQDIDRSGSFPYHVERALQLTMSLAYQLKDASTIISIITTLVANMEARSEEFILKERQGALLIHAVSRLYILAMESSSPKLLRSELYRAWQVVSRCKALVVRTVETRLQTLIEHIFGSVANFVAEQSVIEDNKKKQVRKRKLTSYDLGALQSHPVLLVPGAIPSPSEMSAGGNDPLKRLNLANECALLWLTPKLGFFEIFGKHGRATEAR
ncbi:hypothetical protein ANCCEY_07642 [Ancylostoma ceylanicum]|uniref:Uncharacterized protein n=1 Tax=Ancylostoma ceylanicum TaxID=53326 RepID=A0A0D6M074_9BILA|nr:hypothetical protein ANCCEY_07642 [Ancylostoma ceylanicum]